MRWICSLAVLVLLAGCATNAAPSPESLPDVEPVDVAAQLDLTGLPEGVSAEIDGVPIAGVVNVDAVPHEVVVFVPGGSPRSILVTPSANETVRPDLTWLPEAIAAGKRHDELRAKGLCKCDHHVDPVLEWLTRHQDEDGAWRADGFSQHCPTDAPCGPPSHGSSALETTSLALLAYLAYGETHTRGDYRRTVRAGLDFIAQSDPWSHAPADPATEHPVRDLALKTAVLMHAQSMAGRFSRRYADAAQSSMDRLIELRWGAPNAADGSPRGWDAHAEFRHADAATTAWAGLAIATGLRTNLSVPKTARAEALLDVESLGDPSSSSMDRRLAALLTLARIQLGAAPDDPVVRAACARLAGELAAPEWQGSQDPAADWLTLTVMLQASTKSEWKACRRSWESLATERVRDGLPDIAHFAPPKTSATGSPGGTLHTLLYGQLTIGLYYRWGGSFASGLR